MRDHKPSVTFLTKHRQSRRTSRDGHSFDCLVHDELVLTEAAAIVARAYPRLDPGPQLSLAGPRLLSLGDLERVRDALAGRVVALRGVVLTL